MSKSSLEYLKNIYILYKQNSILRVTDIASTMKCSKPNVVKHLNVLKDKGLIEYETYGKISITDEGIKISKEILEEDDVIYLLLRNVIGIDNDNLKDDASKIKNSISKETYDELYEYVISKLGLNSLSCNFNMKNEKCRKCIIGGNHD